MDQAIITSRIKAIASKRELLVKLLDKPDLGTLRLDVNQAIEELDDLIDELHSTFPETV